MALRSAAQHADCDAYSSQIAQLGAIVRCLLWVDQEEYMALTKCPECGRDVSEMAAACTGCGCPVDPQLKPRRMLIEDLRAYRDVLKISVPTDQELNAQNYQQLRALHAAKPMIVAIR